MRARNTFVRCLPPRHRRPVFTGAGLARAVPPSAATNGVPTRTRRHSTTSAIDNSPSTLANDRLPGALPLFTTTRCTSRCSGGALGAPAAQVESQPRARRGRRLSSWKRTSLSRAPASAPWRETRSSKAHQGPPRARRANGRASGTSQDAFRCTRSRPVLFDPEWPYFGELAPASYAPFTA